MRAFAVALTACSLASTPAFTNILNYPSMENKNIYNNGNVILQNCKIIPKSIRESCHPKSVFLKNTSDVIPGSINKQKFLWPRSYSYESVKMATTLPPTRIQDAATSSQRAVPSKIGAFSRQTVAANTMLTNTPSTIVKLGPLSQASVKPPRTQFTQSPPVQCVNILAFGGDRTGRNDNSAAFASAVKAGNGCVRLPSGIYRFSARPTISLGSMATASATIIGEGADVTVLRFDSGISGPAIILGANDQSIHVRDLSIVSAGIPASTIGLSIALITDSGSTPTQSDITGVTIRGSDGYAKTNSFGTLFSLSGVSNVTFINDNFIGTSGGAAFATSSGPTCVKLVGTANSPPVQFNFLAVQANYCSAGIYYGKYVQGVSVSSSNFVGNHYGILIDSGQIGNDQLAVSTSQFNNGAADIIVKSLIDGVTITGNDFYSITSGGVGIALNQVDSYAIVGNTFIGINSTDQNAITIGGGLGGTVTGNQFKGPSFANCILLDKGSSGANVQSNSYVGSCVHVKNLGGSANTVGGGSP